MEQLNKQQITLLCLLIALFTSIASSVITASLMDKSGAGISQTIFRVVEKTIQEVAPKDSAVVRKIAEKEAAKPAEVQSLSQIVENAQNSLVSIWMKNRNGEGTYLATGAVIGDKNTVLVFDGANLQRNEPYYVRLNDGREVKMERKDEPPFSGMRILGYVEDEAEKPVLKGLKISPLAVEKLGANVVALGSKMDNYVVSTGIIAEFPETTEAAKNSVVTDINLSSSASGWILLNTSGNVIGFLAPSVEGDKGARYSNTNKALSSNPELF